MTSSVASDEATPLLTERTERTEDGDERACLAMKDSIYSFMLFQPPLARRRAGHYYTWEVILAFALLLLNLTLQMGLTLIAGNKIVQAASDFSKTLVNSEFATTPWAQAIDEGFEELDREKQYVESQIWTDNEGTIHAPRCCDGAECAAFGLPCCDRRGAKPHQFLQPAAGSTSAFLHLRKPGKSGGEEGQETTTISSLCQIQRSSGGNSTLVCTPLSYGFLEAWDYLDSNGDGMWTLEEARMDEANLGCRLGLSVEEVFRSTCRGVLRDSEDTLDNPPYVVHHVPLSVSERRAVPRSAFDQWKGLAVICVVHDVARCGELIKRGVFDGAIRADNRFTKGGVQDLDTALDYCQRLLRPGGICEKTLPGAYMMYRSRVREKCGTATFSTGERYTNPYDDRDVMQTIQITYSTYDKFHTASSPEFKFFLGLILFLWYVNLVGELRAVIELADFLMSFPTNQENPLVTHNMRRKGSLAFQSIRSLGSFEEKRKGQDGIERTKRGFIELHGHEEGLEQWERAELLIRTFSSQSLGSENVDKFLQTSSPQLMTQEDKYVVFNISRPHQVTCSIMLFTRMFILFYMFHVGSNFLITRHSYDDLLLDAVALAFIFELPEFLYAFLVPDDLKEALNGARTDYYPTNLPTSQSYWQLPFKRSFWGFVIIPAVVFALVIFNYRVTTMPSLRALQCTCFQEGDHCEVASHFTRAWSQNRCRFIVFVTSLYIVSLVESALAGALAHIRYEFICSRTQRTIIMIVGI